MPPVWSWSVVGYGYQGTRSCRPRFQKNFRLGGSNGTCSVAESRKSLTSCPRCQQLALNRLCGCVPSHHTLRIQMRVTSTWSTLLQKVSSDLKSPQRHLHIVRAISFPSLESASVKGSFSRGRDDNLQKVLYLPVVAYWSRKATVYCMPLLARHSQIAHPSDVVLVKVRPCGPVLQ